jgi:hypothetical protein
MDNINVNQQQKKPRKDVSGCHNPMYGRKHSEASRNKMSKAATLRNQQYKDALRNQHYVSMDESLPVNPKVEEYIKLLASKVMKEVIDKMVWKKQHSQRIQIPL